MGSAGFDPQICVICCILSEIIIASMFASTGCPGHVHAQDGRQALWTLAEGERIGQPAMYPVPICADHFTRLHWIAQMLDQLHQTLVQTNTKLNAPNQGPVSESRLCYVHSI